MTPPFIARWDLDKTYLRTDFDTLRDLVRTAFERPDQKRTVPGAGSLLRELSNAGARIHILSGSPEQMRSRIEQKLRLDGARFDSLTLKPNLQNFLRLRLRALRDQLGFKLPVLLRSRLDLEHGREAGASLPEVLLGDDAEADAFVYSLYADICAGRVGPHTLAEIMRRGRAYDDAIADALELARGVERDAPVERIFIHLDRQSRRSRFAAYGGRVVPFYNYLQVALVLGEAGRLPAAGVVRVAAELVLEHRFDADRLARSYLDMVRRACAKGSLGPALRAAADAMVGPGPMAVIDEVRSMCDRLEALLPSTPTLPPPPFDPLPDYLSLIYDHNLRRKHTLAPMLRLPLLVLVAGSAGPCHDGRRHRHRARNWVGSPRQTGPEPPFGGSPLDSDLADSVSALKAIFERRRLPFEFGKADAALVEQLRKALRIPARFRAFLLEANPKQVETSSPVERVRLFPAEEFLTEQRGFALLDDGSPRTEAKDGAWRRSWVLIGRSSLLGDPYFLDVAKLDPEGDCPVYTAMSGTERWEPRLCASSFAQFLRILTTAMEVAQGFGEAILDDEDEASFREALGSKLKAIDVAALRAGHWT